MRGTSYSACGSSSLNCILRHTLDSILCIYAVQAAAAAGGSDLTANEQYIAYLPVVRPSAAAAAAPPLRKFLSALYARCVRAQSGLSFASLFLSQQQQSTISKA
eukprot:2713-Heterococcus_DN1.PRE.2